MLVELVRLREEGVGSWWVRRVVAVVELAGLLAREGVVLVVLAGRFWFWFWCCWCCGIGVVVWPLALMLAPLTPLKLWMKGVAVWSPVGIEK